MKTMRNLERFASWIDMIAAAMLLLICVSQVYTLLAGIDGDWRLFYSNTQFAEMWRDKVFECAITGLRHIAVAWIGYVPFNLLYRTIHSRVIKEEERV